VWAGTMSSIFTYLKRIKIVWKLMIPTTISAFSFAFLGAMSVSYIPKDVMTYLVFFLLIIMAIYTFTKKGLGQTHTNIQCSNKETLRGIIFGELIGFLGWRIWPWKWKFLIVSLC
jgi:uncharacterized membrane protein YfcA